MWAPGCPPGPAGWDRRRVGARLRAALAGLQELQGLRATQQARVRGALAMQPAPGPAEPRGPRGQELRLEAALAALQEQLEKKSHLQKKRRPVHSSRLRRQDAGLKAHLDQLDQQISELQLDMCRPSCEAPDSDSRPSSGFYELSDAGSCSLSTSCASVCSDRLSPALGSWLPAFQPSRARPSMGDWRPRSADETTVPGWKPQPSGEGSGPPDHGEDTDWPWGLFRPRPVSTGDLERVLAADPGLPRAGVDAVSTSLLCQDGDVPSHALDPKYQRDLVARGGQEVYLYPSPLHAVALQSPLFALTKETPQLNGRSPPREPPWASRGPGGSQAGPVREVGPPGAYINRLLHLRGLGDAPRGGVREQGPPRCDGPSSPEKPGGQTADSSQPEKLVCASAGDEGSAQSGAAWGDIHGQQVPVPLVDTESSSSPPEGGVWNRCICGETSIRPSPWPPAPQPHSNCGRGQVLFPLGTVGPKSPLRAPGPSAHPPSTASEASLLSPKAGSTQTKALKARRRASDKVLRFGKQPPLLVERYRGIHDTPQLPPAWDPWPRPQAGGLRRRPMPAREAPGRSCSESTLCPTPFLVPLVAARQEGHQGSAQALFPGEAAALGAGARKKQRRWRSTMEISARAPAGCPEPSLGPLRPVTRRAGSPCARPSLARQDACAQSESDPSEHSAECSSLFHSTIAETSGDEASDHTANRFGDQESGGSDAEGAARSGRGLVAGGTAGGWGEPAWPRAAPQQPTRALGGSRPPLPPVPKLCRIKASKALKKKIRRFQPAALKVMTLV